MTSTSSAEKSPAGATAVPAQPQPRSRATSPGLLLALVLTGQFMAMLDVAIVNVAMPTMEADLDASGAALQLVVSGYTIAYAILLITGARLGERWGFSRLFQIGLSVFTAASLACGLAPSTDALIGFRVVQGVGAALMVPQVMSLIQRTFVGAARLRALGVYTAVLSSGMVLGQVLGGLLVSADLFGLGWRPVFLINVPIGLALLGLGGRRLPLSRGTARPLDLPGLILLAAAVGLLVVPLVLGHELGWPWWAWVSLGASAAVAVLFGLVERRTASSGGHPLIHGRVVRAPGMALSALSVFFVMVSVSGVMFAFALHLQAGLGESALRVGLSLAPLALGFGLAGYLWRRLPAAIHGLLAPAGLALAAAGYVVLGIRLDGGGQVSAGLELMLFGMGLVSGCAYGQLFASALARVEVRDAADASGVMVTVLQLGQVVGVATIGSLFLSRLGSAPSVTSSARAFEVSLFGVAALVLAAGVASALRPRTSVA